MNKFKEGDRVVRKAEYRADSGWNSKCSAFHLPHDHSFMVVGVSYTGHIRLSDFLEGADTSWWISYKFDYAPEKMIVECGDED